MKYTSLSHWNTGHNVQQNWNSVEEWQDYCKEDTSVVWSKLFKSVDGELIGEYPERLQKSPAVAVPDGYALLIDGDLNRNWVTFNGRNKSEKLASAEGMRDNYISNCRPVNLPKLEIVPLYRQSPRITEQDALQIIKSWSGHFDQETFEMWVIAKGSALFDKLNRESK